MCPYRRFLPYPTYGLFGLRHNRDRAHIIKAKVDVLRLRHPKAPIALRFPASPVSVPAVVSRPDVLGVRGLVVWALCKLNLSSGKTSGTRRTTLLSVDSGEYRGALLGESLELGAVIELPLAVHRVTRAAAGDTDAGQPRDWTFIEFSVKAEEADALARALSKALRREGGWYCNFNSADEVVVVFHGRVFRYRSRDLGARTEVEQYARSVGVPESQLDWTDPQ